MSKRPVTWIGPLAGAAAYPLINRHMTAALEVEGVTVQRNFHNIGEALTPVAVACAYPPFVPHVKHDLNAAFFTWEFQGIRSFPRSFLKVFNQLDMVITMSQWVADQLEGHVDCVVAHVPLGFDPQEFTPEGEFFYFEDAFPGESWYNDPNELLLWVGGTDQRHGLDIAVKVLDKLPENVHLIAKWGSSYPAPTFAHPRLHYLSQDMNSLAPLYRSVDGLLHTARGVGFALPVLEAIACGLPVVSTDTPPVREYGYRGVAFASRGAWQPFKHHLHPDCAPVWWEPDVDELVEVTLLVLKQPGMVPGEGALNRHRRELWRAKWSWGAAAFKMKQLLAL